MYAYIYSISRHEEILLKFNFFGYFLARLYSQGCDLYTENREIHKGISVAKLFFLLLIITSSHP